MSIAPARPDSLEVLFRRCYAHLVSSLSLVGGREAAEDAVQEAFARASVHWWRIRHYDEPGAWVRRVAINQMLTSLRSDARKGSAERATSSPAPASSTSLDCSIDVRQALDALPARQRLYLILQQVEQMRIREIATATGTAEGTVKSGLYDARRKMFDTLGADYEA